MNGRLVKALRSLCLMQGGLTVLEQGSGWEPELSPGRRDLRACVGKGSPGVWGAEGLVPRARLWLEREFCVVEIKGQRGCEDENVEEPGGPGELRGTG